MRAQAQRSQQAQVLRVPRGRHQHGVGDVGGELRQARAHHVVDAARGLGIRGVELGQPLRQLHLGRVHVDGGHLPRRGGGVSRQVHRAPVRQPGHQQARGGGERALQVERGGEQLPGLGQQAQPLLGAHHLGDFPEDVDGVHHLASRVAHGGRGHPAPVLLARALVAEAQHHLGGVPSGEHLPAGQFAEAHRVAPGIEHLVALEHHGASPVQQLLPGRGAEDAGRGGVGEAQREVPRLHGDAVAHLREERLHQRAGVLEELGEHLRRQPFAGRGRR